MPVIAQIPAAVQPFFPGTAQAPAPSETVTVTAPPSTAGNSDKSFFDNLLDVVNPLEHLPVVSTIYSNLTGDKPNDFTQVAGDLLYGGPLGFLSSIGNLVFKDVTGKTVGDTVWGWVTDKSGDTRTASVKSAPSPRKPSSDLFSFLSAGNDPRQPDSSTAAPAVPSAVASKVAPAPQPATATAASSESKTASTTPSRIFNPLPVRGAPPAHNTPSENVRAADMAQMIASRAHLHAPTSEGNSPAMQPAASVPTTTPVAATKMPTVSVGSDGIPTLDGNGEQALLDALKKNGISGAIGQQALMAYQKTMAMNPGPSAAEPLTSAMTLH
ncbi:MAG TPA: hypothetical protein VGG36_07370 [Rhizomicrobium sp.]|jgi:hypothetical protein